MSTQQSFEASLTAGGVVVGTPYYMSPEQLLDEELDGRSDIFSLGILLYEMATGTLPFKGRDQLAVFHAIVNNPHDPVFQFNPDLPDGLETIINNALEKDRTNRYRSVEELLVDLKRLKRDLDSGKATTRKLLAKNQQIGNGSVGAEQKGSRKAFHPLWWVVHQINVILFYGLMVLAAWYVKELTPGIWGVGLFFGVFGCVALNGTLRTHLLFTARFNRSAITTEMQRVSSWLKRCDWFFCFQLLWAGAVVSEVHHVMAGILTALAISYVVVFLVVEPVTTRASFSQHGESAD